MYQVRLPTPALVGDDDESEPDAVDLFSTGLFSSKKGESSKTEVNVIVVESDGESGRDGLVGRNEEQDGSDVEMGHNEVSLAGGSVVPNLMKQNTERTAARVGWATEDIMMQDVVLEPVGAGAERGMPEDVVDMGDARDEEVDELDSEEEDEVKPLEAAKVKSVKANSNARSTNIKITSGGTGKVRNKGNAGDATARVEFEGSSGERFFHC